MPKVLQYNESTKRNELISVIPVNLGGTNISSYTVGDILYASGSSTLSKLADVATGNVLLAGGVGVAPSYGKINLSSHVTALTASRATVTDASGFVSASTITSTELGYLSGVTSNIQTQFSNKASTGAITTNGNTMSTAKLLGRTTAGTGSIEEITLGTNLSFSGNILNASGGLGATNLSIINSGASTLDIASDTGTDVTIPAATGSLAGLLTASDKTKLDSISEVDYKYAASTGVVNGGILSIGTPNTTFSISDGFGYIIDATTNPNTPVLTKVTWSGKTNIPVTNIGSQNITFISINSSGNVLQSSTRWTTTKYRDEIILGVVVHVDRTIVDAVNNEQAVTLNPTSQVFDIMEAIGFVNISGNTFKPNGANLQIDKSAGEIMAHGANWPNNTKDPNHLSLGVLTALTFQYRFQNGVNGATGTNINPNIYDASGVSTAVPTNKWTVQRVYSFTSNNVKIQPGQHTYNTAADAKAAIQFESFVTEPSVAANGLLRGFIIVKQGATALNNILQAEFIEANKFGTPSGSAGASVSTMQAAYNNSEANPEIITTTAGGAVQIRRGTAADTDAVFEIQNGAGTAVFTVTGSGMSSTQINDSTVAGRTLLTAVDASAQRTALGLGTLATQSGTFSGTSSGTNTGDQTITLTGDVTGTGTGSFAATLATVATAGTTGSGSLIPVITIDAKGRTTSITTATNAPAFSNITSKPTTIAGYGITNGALNGAVTASGITMSTARILYRKTAGTGAIEEQTLATLKTDLGIGGVENYNAAFTGTQNGSNTVFTISLTIIANTERVYRNGLRLKPGVGNDYTISGSVVTFAVAPLSTDNLIFDAQV